MSQNSQLQKLDLQVGRNLVYSLKGVVDSGDRAAFTRTFAILDGMVALSTQKLEEFRKLQAVSLWIMSEIWDGLPYETTTQWNSYMDWAYQRTNYDESTIRNYIRAARVYYDPHLQLPDRIELCDKNGEPVIEGRSGRILSINPDPFEPSISKLILTSKAFEEGRLTDVQLGMVFNPKVSWGSLAESLRDQRLQSLGRPMTRFLLDGTQLIIIEDGESEAFGELYLYNESNRLVRKGINHILLAAGIVTT